MFIKNKFKNKNSDHDNLILFQNIKNIRNLNEISIQRARLPLKLLKTKKRKNNIFFGFPENTDFQRMAVG